MTPIQARTQEFTRGTFGTIINVVRRILEVYYFTRNLVKTIQKISFFPKIIRIGLPFTKTVDKKMKEILNQLFIYFFR